MLFYVLHTLGEKSKKKKGKAEENLYIYDYGFLLSKHTFFLIPMSH